MASAGEFKDTGSSRIPIKILQFTGWYLPTKNYMAPNVNSMKIKKPCPTGMSEVI